MTLLRFVDPELDAVEESEIWEHGVISASVAAATKRVRI